MYIGRSAGRRRTVGWNYGRRGVDKARDGEAVKWVFGGEWESWPQARKQLWGLEEERVPVASKVGTGSSAQHSSGTAAAPAPKL